MSLDPRFVADVVARALAEDVGAGDVTTQATVPPGAQAVATITQKAPGVVFGLDVAEATFRQADESLQIERLCPNSTAIPARQTAQGSRVCGSRTAGAVTDGNVVSHG